MNNIYEVVFKQRGKRYYFSSDKKIDINSKVIVSTEKGQQLGLVVGKAEKSKVKVAEEEIKEILRIADEADYDQYLENTKLADKALKKCRKFVEELNLEMDIINASFTFDRSQLIFNFIADERVDFRELAKKLAGVYKTRIELRQIGARDKAKEISGIGPCGRKLCCSSFLQHIDSVSMNMAKNQNVSLNPQKINGMCSRLLCCLAYEDDEYIRCSKNLPTIGEKIKVDGEYCPVVATNILQREITVMVGNETRKISYKDETVK